MPTTVKPPFTISYPNEIEFKKLYEEVFKKHLYYCELETNQPRILDVGGHIGLATLYFKKTYPDAWITVFEPEPNALRYLQKNIQQNNLQDVDIVEKAVSDHDGEALLYVDAEDENHWLSTSSLLKGSWTLREDTVPITVQTTKLSHYLEFPVDILKIDVEGAETQIIQESVSHFLNVRHFFIEYHTNPQSQPHEFLKLLNPHHDFQLTIYDQGKEIKPAQMVRQKPTFFLIEGKQIF